MNIASEIKAKAEELMLQSVRAKFRGDTAEAQKYEQECILLCKLLIAETQK